MSLENWRLLTIIFSIIFVLLILILLMSKPLKNKYNYACREDQLVKSEKRKGARYNVYSVFGRSAYYVDKYILKEVGKHKTLICDYVKNYQFIAYYLLLFNKKGNIIKIMEVSEYNTTFCSKAIKLPRRCTKINVVVKNVDDKDLNINLVGQVSKPAVIVFSIFESVALFCFLFALRHVLIEIICLDTKIIFLRSTYDVYSIVLIALFAFINYLIISSRLKKTYHHKVAKAKGGK